jgi:hypothetical protein
MAWLRWHVVAGLRRSPLHNSLFTWNGGEPTTILCGPMHRFEWHSYTLENEGANVWLNSTGSVHQPWQREERTDDGQRGRYSLTHCRQFPGDQALKPDVVAVSYRRRSMKVRAEVVGWSLLPGYGGLPGLHHDEKGSRRGLQRLIKLSTTNCGCTL